MNEGLNLNTVGLDDAGYQVNHDGGWEEFKRAVRRGEKRFYARRGEQMPHEMDHRASVNAEVKEAAHEKRQRHENE